MGLLFNDGVQIMFRMVVSLAAFSRYAKGLLNVWWDWLMSRGCTLPIRKVLA